MSFGYLIIAAKNSQIDYHKLAYALAVSIKNTQKWGFNNVALITDDPTDLERFKSPWVFDQVITWNKQKGWNGRSYMDQLTPWDHTVCLDADMIFQRDFSHCIEYFIENCELYVANDSWTYRGDKVTGDFYRKAFTKNDLPNLYSFFTYFKKDSDLAKEFFTLGRYIIENPKEFSNMFLSNAKPKIMGTDEAFALSSKILDITDQIAYPLEFPKVVHMKGMIQDWPWPADTWSDHVGFYFDPANKLKIGNFIQTDIVHYVDKTIITDEIVSLQEEILWQK
jgi:hypothetical protein